LSAPLVRSNWFKADVLAAFAWYHQQAGRPVATRLAHAVRDTLKLVADHPEIAPVRSIAGVRIRSFPLREFPYVLYWDYDGETVLLAALLHGSRDRDAILAARHPWKEGGPAA
jgi:plasmid stabilization system protein ParE